MRDTHNAVVHTFSCQGACVRATAKYKEFLVAGCDSGLIHVWTCVFMIPAFIFRLLIVVSSFRGCYSVFHLCYYFCCCFGFCLFVVV